MRLVIFSYLGLGLVINKGKAMTPRAGKTPGGGQWLKGALEGSYCLSFLIIFINHL